MAIWTTSGRTEVRRLSTISAVKAPAGQTLSTRWLWYWKDDGEWRQYGEVINPVKINFIFIDFEFLCLHFICKIHPGFHIANAREANSKWIFKFPNAGVNAFDKKKYIWPGTINVICHV